MRAYVLQILAALTALCIGSAAAKASGYQVLHSFQNDGRYPSSALLNVGGTLYGTTRYGGPNNNGTIFSINPTTGLETLLFAFDGTNGSDSTAPLINVGGILYGTTLLGGSQPYRCVSDGQQPCGNIFAFDPATGAEKEIYAFKGGADGESPYAGLLNIGGTLYGTTVGGGGSGCSSGCGTVFALNLQTGTEKVIYAFQGGLDGDYPEGKLIDVGGLLYGTTFGGGASPNCSYGCGTVFSVDPTTGVKKTIYTFQGGNDGGEPYAGLLNVDGRLYGTASVGGAFGGTSGVVFSVNPATGTETIIHAFQGGRLDGAYPLCDLIAVKGKLIGTTDFGGVSSRHGDGTVFSVDLATGSESILHFFRGGTTDGYSPGAAVVNLGQSIYGTTAGGGLGSNGTIYGITR